MFTAAAKKIRPQNKKQGFLVAIGLTIFVIVGALLMRQFFLYANPELQIDFHTYKPTQQLQSITFAEETLDVVHEGSELFPTNVIVALRSKEPSFSVLQFKQKDASALAACERRAVAKCRVAMTPHHQQFARAIVGDRQGVTSESVHFIKQGTQFYSSFDYSPHAAALTDQQWAAFIDSFSMAKFTELRVTRPTSGP